MNDSHWHEKPPEERREALLRLARLRRKCALLEERLGLRPAGLPEPTTDVGAAAWQLVAIHASDFISIHDPNGDYLFASANCAGMFGWAAEELVGRNAYELFHPDDLLRIAADHAQHGSGAEGSVQYRLLCKGGDWRWVETRSQAAEERGQIVCITRDIEQARAYQQLLEARSLELEDQLERAREDLLRAEKLATLGTLAAGVGHELSSLSTVYRLALDLVRDRTDVARPVGPREMALLERVDRHLAAHASHLLTMAQPPLRVEPVDMLEVVEGTIEILRLAGKLKGVDVTTCAPPEVLRVRADRARLEQVLVNLLTNAADAVATAPRRSVSVKIARQDTTIALSVTDSGSGIPPDHLEKVFEPYFTTKEPGKGTGLGLPVVRQIATSLGGTATIRSRPGVGTTVDVQLPSA